MVRRVRKIGTAVIGDPRRRHFEMRLTVLCCRGLLGQLTWERDILEKRGIDRVDSQTLKRR